MSIVIFGERPGPNTDPDRPLFPHSTTGAAANLAQLLGMSLEEYVRGTVRYNVCDDPWTSTADRTVRLRVRSILEMHRKQSRDNHFIVLGRDTARAFPPEYRYAPFGHHIHDTILIPHTSGVNRYYNSQEDKEFIKQSLKDFLGRS